ncbi:hypothetical protein EYB45_08520 [Erythrobacteraceae bacterium CFH 75059]|uniref:hypothetical protein n=1 Tax=Qipengyuania thermophila TaxID=2509361 RepID=UPI0010204541|nr:hypothetical protein [Qipengyuania thermophila]TCD04280.1 hypothetical protein EYB45_08520 [Erythrobacteraceae bacterium CFH 75059]
MRVVGPNGLITLGVTEATPTISIRDYSRREPDEFGDTVVVERGFSRRLSVRMMVPSDNVDALQQQFAELRAMQATWIADEESEWLSPVGFYRDFEVDISTPEHSYCTLSVEGLAETEVATDPGGDPAPAGKVSTLRIVDGETELALGLTEASAKVGITDFSRKGFDEFGDPDVVERAWAKRMTVRALIRTDMIDVVANRIAAVRARPVTWVADEEYDSLSIEGFFKEFSIERGEQVSTLSLEIEGLSTASPAPAPFPIGATPEQVEAIRKNTEYALDIIVRREITDEDVAALDLQARGTARQADLDALVAQTLPLDSRITDARNRADAAAEQVAAAQESANQALSEIASQVVRLDERIDNVSAAEEYDDTAIFAEVQRVDSAALGRDAALAESISTVSAGLTDTDSAWRAEVSRVEQAAVAADTAISQRIDMIVADGNGGDTDLFARSEIARVEQAYVNADNALASQINNVSASIGPAVNAKAQELTTAYSNADTAIVQQITTLKGGYNGTLGQFDSRITTLADAQGALADSLVQLRAGYTGNLAQFDNRITAAQNAAGNAVAQTTLLQSQFNLTEDSALYARLRTEEQARADAVGQIASRTSVLEVSAERSALNRNPAFAQIPPGDPAVPPHWTLGGAPPLIATALATGNAQQTGWLIRPNGASTTSIYGDLFAAGPGDYVLEADWALMDGPDVSRATITVAMYNASGALLDDSRAIPLATLREADGHTHGSGEAVKGRFRTMRTRHRVTVTNPAHTHIRLFVFFWGGSAPRDWAYRWDRLALRPMTPQEVEAGRIIPLEATVEQQAGAIADIRGSAAFFETLVQAGGGNPAVVRLQAGWNGSTIVQAADRLLILNPANGQFVEVARFEGGQARLNDALIRRLRVAPNVHSAIYLPVQLEPLRLTGPLGQPLQYDNGRTFGLRPARITADLSQLPAPAAGERYEFRPVAVTETGFTPTVVRIGAGAATVQQQSPAGVDMGSGVAPRWQAGKPTEADAGDGYYTYTLDLVLNKVDEQYYGPGTGQPGYPEGQMASYLARAEFSGRTGAGVWVYLGAETWTEQRFAPLGQTNPATVPLSVQHTVQSTADLTSGAGVFGVQPTAGAVTALHHVRYLTSSGATETPVSGTMTYTIHPARD